jgi:hypothetical protein
VKPWIDAHWIDSATSLTGGFTNEGRSGLEAVFIFITELALNNLDPSDM